MTGPFRHGGHWDETIIFDPVPMPPPLEPSGELWGMALNGSKADQMVLWLNMGYEQWLKDQ